MKDDKWAMLCKLVVTPFDDPMWVFERKYDGVRMRADISAGVTRLTARSGADKTAQFPEIRIRLPDCVKTAVLDGEVVSGQGLPFQEFAQRRMNRSSDLAMFAASMPARHMVFDLLELDGEDMRGKPLEERRRLLLLAMPAGLNRNVEVVSQYDSGRDAFSRAKANGWEGVVGKRLDEPYMPGKRAWVKVKAWQERTFWCIGYTGGAGKRAKTFGALVVKSDDGKLRAEVGTGFDDATLAELVRTMVPLGPVDDRCPYVPVLRFRVRVKYCEVTNSGSLRFPVYLGLGGMTWTGTGSSC